MFNEVAIADLNQFQIAVLTRTQLINRCILSVSVPVPKRFYHTQGWLIYKQQIIAQFDALKVGSIFSEGSPFKPIHRLAQATPISFEVRSHQPLPPQMSAQSAFACQLPETDFPNYTVFREIIPRFVKLYPFETGSSLLEKVEQMLTARDLFISQNYERLKQIPFYQENFGLQAKEA
ncbi:MAG: hypothetical protein AAGF01_05610 [Cyanobacteria bacterium P01_G01_bin.38]